MYDCPHPKIEFDVQDESKLLLFLLLLFCVKKPTLWVFEAGPVQRPPTVPHSASLFSSPSFRLSSSLAVKESAAVWSPLG